jgi:hypothetical protein
MYSFKVSVNGKTVNSPKQLLTGKELLELACLIPIEDYELLLETNRKGYEPIQLTETVDLSDPGIEHFTAKLYKSIKIFIDDIEYSVDECNSTPIKLLELAGYNNSTHYLTQIQKGDVEIGYKEQNDAEHKINLRENAKFYSHSRVKSVFIKIDESTFEVKKGKYTGKELKKIGGVPDRYELEQVCNGIITINDNDCVVIKGDEVFISHPKDGQSS